MGKLMLVLIVFEVINFHINEQGSAIKMKTLQSFYCRLLLRNDFKLKQIKC